MARHADRATLLNVHNERIRDIGIGEAERMLEGGEAIRISRPKANKLIIRLRELRKPHACHELIATTITMGEMEANVGLRGPRRRARRRGYVGNFVDRTMSKIEIWPEVGDTRAVRVGPRGVSQPKPPQSARAATNARLFNRRQA